MRYQDWDVLIFPRDTNVPTKEFKVDCHVVHDTEFGYNTGSCGLPTLTCFTPSLSPGAPFHISVHSWRTPEISRLTRAYSKHPEAIKFEARVFIDGYLVASAAFDRHGRWPHLIADTFELDKHGDRETLAFPPFRKELLREDYWNPADDYGRIKVVISEGFPRDSPTHPIERVKNVVAFTFQHAPLEILEGCGIAWPSPAMWSRTPLAATMHVPTYYPEDGSTSHQHSPRRRASHSLRSSSPSVVPPNVTYTLPSQYATGSGSRSYDLVMRGSSGNMSTDMSMPDYISSSQSSRVPTMSYADPISSVQLQEPSLEKQSRSVSLKVPANTPTAAKLGGASTPECKLSGPPRQRRRYSQHDSNPADLAASLTESLLHNAMPLQAAQQLSVQMPAQEIKSRKENWLTHTDGHPRARSSAHSCKSLAERVEIRKVSQPLLGRASPSRPGDGGICQSSDWTSESQRNTSGRSEGLLGVDLTKSSQQESEPEPGSNSGGRRGVLVSGGTDQGVKRVRRFTPASARAIDEEDEPQRVTSRARIASLVSNLTIN